MKSDSFFNNKYVLYVVVFLTLTNFFGYLMVQNTEAIIFMIIIGYLTTYFSKNMIIILLVALLATNFLISLNMIDNKQKQLLVENMASASSRRPRRKSPRAATAALDQDMATGAPSKFDFGSTVEDAHDSIDKLLKSGMTGKDASNLLKQQNQMMKNLKSFEPMMAKATNILEHFDPEALGKLTNSLGQMGGMLNGNIKKNK